MSNVVDQALERLGGLHITVANAGIVTYYPLAQLTARRWQDVIDTNLTGVANIMRAAVPHLTRQRRGAFIAVTSTEGRHGAPSSRTTAPPNGG